MTQPPSSLNSYPATPPAGARAAEQRRSPRVDTAKTGRLAYGGLHPGMVGCRILDLSANGVRVETYATLSEVPEFFTLEFEGTYYRAQRIWTHGNEIGLDFAFDDWLSSQG